MGAASQTFALVRFQTAGQGKTFVNACYCSVHKYIFRNVFTDLEHNDADI